MNSELKMREERDYLLLLSDWTQVNDSPLSAEKKAEWATYRQELRDLTNDPMFPFVSFPAMPEKEVVTEESGE